MHLDFLKVRLQSFSFLPDDVEEKHELVVALRGWGGRPLMLAVGVVVRVRGTPADPARRVRRRLLVRVWLRAEKKRSLTYG